MNIFHPHIPSTRQHRALWLGLFALLAAPRAPVQAERPAPNTSSTKRQNPLARVATEATKPVTLEASLNLGNIADGNRFARPSQGLAFALRKHPDISQFRLVWSMEIPSVQTKINCTLFYHRRKRTLTFYSAGEIFGTTVREHWRDRGVTDTLIFRLADKAKDSRTGDDSAHFKQLVKMGSQREMLK